MKHAQLSRHPFALLLPLALLACAATSDERHEDSSEQGEIPRYEAVVDFEIESGEEPGPYLFSDISGLTLDAAGRIYVAERQANEIRVFSPAGAHLYTIGRPGSGPGELQAPCCLALDPEGRLWVRDRGNGRYNGYELGDDGAQHFATLRMVHGDDGYTPQLTFSADGHLIDIGNHAPDRDSERALYRFHLDLSGATVRTEVIHTMTPVELGARVVSGTMALGGMANVSFNRYLWPAYHRRQLFAHAPGGGWVEAVNDRYEIAWYGPDGSPRHTLSRETPLGPLVSPEERARQEEYLREEAERFNQTPLPVPDRKQPLATLFFDHDGRLWVQHSNADGERVRADIYAPNGTPAGEVAWPNGVVLSHGAIRGDRAVGIAYDELDVPRLVVLRLH